MVRAVLFRLDKGFYPLALAAVNHGSVFIQKDLNAFAPHRVPALDNNRGTGKKKLGVGLKILGPVRARRMFGAHGLFLHGRMFGLVARGEIHLKAAGPLGDGSRRFTYGTKKGEVRSLPYWTLPDAALDDPDAACALAAAVVARLGD